MSSSKYPEPFNPHPPKFSAGDRIISRGGRKGTILGENDFDSYKLNRPGPKWELVAWDDFKEATWVGDIWIKKL